MHALDPASASLGEMLRLGAVHEDELYTGDAARESISCMLTADDLAAKIS